MTVIVAMKQAWLRSF